MPGRITIQLKLSVQHLVTFIKIQVVHAHLMFDSKIQTNTGTLDKLAAFWAKVASVFKDAPNILGYEIINEPWAGKRE